MSVARNVICWRRLTGLPYGHATQPVLENPMYFALFLISKTRLFTFFETTGQKVVISRPRSFEMTAVKMNSKY